MRILVTGAGGLIGTALCRHLRSAGHSTVKLDSRIYRSGDVTNRPLVEEISLGCDGIVHLAAVSRVVWGQRDPFGCYRTNIGGTCSVLEAAVANRAWVIFASSREVYGESLVIPVVEDVELRPVNIYGYSKLAAEKLVLESRSHEVNTAVLRFSSVYGSADDHPDRVVPAFARAAAFGEKLRVEGSGHIFDFTHVDDAARGIVLAIDAVGRGEELPPIHFVTGRGTTLGSLAKMAVDACDSTSFIEEASPRTFDVSRFVGDPSRALSLLGWRSQIEVEDGVRELVKKFRSQQ